ncbi:GNAT family N-acetyltransferase [Pseudonocardia sp. GCM10023141]|uniref:GNAT family N-acetyltransferase n=1 Tax=Pseudonocardia sp. GCM10023141 TaxID=3252653 RepID=UPI00361F73F9
MNHTAAGNPLAQDRGDRIRIAVHDGLREALRPLFTLAEDSVPVLDSYLHLGRVLVATAPTGEVLGHLQLVDAVSPDRSGIEDPERAELKNMAVSEELQGQGVGRRLVEAALALLAAERCRTLVVSTAAADIGNLRFYQRLGFRMCSVERDAFTPTTGYPPGIRIDGIELRDRVWLDRPVGLEHVDGDLVATAPTS